VDPVRFYVGKLRRQLELRDRGCAFPGCDRPPAWTHAHHIVAWYCGGATTLDNGVLLCGHHHRLIHQGHWTVAIAADGLPEFTPPNWIDPRRKPIRNHRLRT
jgi:HNH endonuclease